jgi:hypothetical protein
MTIQNTTIRKAGPSQGNGVTTVFPFTFKVFTTADILVTYLDASGVESVLVLSTNYTVSLNADQNTSPGGSVTLLVAPATATYITLTSQLANTQTLALTNSGGFYPESINNALDRTVIEIQQLAEQASRSITIPKSSTASPLMPIPAANNVLVWNNAATALINLPATTGTSLVNLAASTGSTLVGTKTSGTGAVTRTVASKLNDSPSVLDFGAIGDGVTDDTAAITAAITAASLVNGGLYFPEGTYLITSSLVVPNTVTSIFGAGATTSVIKTTNNSLYAITLSGGFSFLSVSNIGFTGPLSTNSASAAIYTTGIAGDLNQKCTFSNIACSGYNVFYKDAQLGRTTGSGLEGGTNWCIFTNLQINNCGSAVFWFTQGSGTGNVFSSSTFNLRLSGSSVWKYEGSGCVVGDIIITGCQLGCYAGSGGIGISTGDNTVYRAQLSITSCQFDAGVDIPVYQSSVGSTLFTNMVFKDNNLGGNAALGASLQPQINMDVIDRNIASWKAGNYWISNTNGANSKNCFQIDFSGSGSCNITVDVGGTIAGRQGTQSQYKFSIRTDGVALEVTNTEVELGLSQYGYIVSVAQGASAFIGIVTVSFISSASGSNTNATINAHGSQFKITRL